MLTFGAAQLRSAWPARLPAKLIAGCALLCCTALPASAACKISLPRGSVDFFSTHPRRLLERYPHGGVSMAYEIRGFASFSRPGLDAVKATVPIANELQRRAIGQGLAIAVVACLARDIETARQIAEVVRRANDDAVLQGYLLVADDEDSKPAANSPDEERHHGPLGVSLDQKLPELNRELGPDVH